MISHNPRQYPTWALDDDEPGISLRRYHHYRLRWLAITILACAVSFVLGGMAHGAYQTPYDTIPGFGENPTIRAVTSGSWDAPATWNAGRIPGKDDIVSIQQFSVTCASSSCIAHAIAVENGGWLTLEPGSDTRLATGVLLVGPQGVLRVNAPNPRHIVTIVIRDIPIDLARDPNQYGTGILIIDGDIVLHGAAKTAFVRTANEPRAGDTTLSLTAEPHGWFSGDTLLLPDSRQWTDNTVRGPYFWEQPVMIGIAGQKVTLQDPLKHHHPGAKDSLMGKLDFTPHVANMTRNITLRSENPQGTRGHFFATRRSLVDLQYVRFQDFGRTTIKTLNTQTNPMAKYILHMHHVIGKPVEGYQFVLRGIVTHGGETDHDFKWSIGLHDSHYGLIEQNVVYNCAGGCIVTEDGSEYRNVIQDNMIVRIRGTENRMGEGTEATGIWLRGGQNIVRRNVVASVPASGPGVQHCGYSVWQQYAGKNGHVRIPTRPGGDTSIPGEYREINIYAEPLAEFADNEAYSAACGVTMWWVGAEYTTPRATQESVVSGLKTWNIYAHSWIHYHVHKLRITGWKNRGTPILSCCQSFFHGLDYFASDLVIEQSDLQGMQHGIYIPTDTQGIQMIRDTRLAVAGDGVQIHTLWTSSHTPKALQARQTILDNVLISRIPGSDFRTVRMAYQDTPVRTLIRPDEVYIKSYQQQNGEDFRIYYSQQAPGFVVPQTTLNTDGTPRLEGAPLPGLTNAQTWGQHGIAIAGAVAPCSDTRPEIAGLVCGGTIQPPPQDTEPPTMPGSLTSVPSSTSVTLLWQASRDNVAVVGYGVSRDGLSIGKAGGPSTSYQDIGLTPNTTYTYAIRAQDAAGNASDPAQAVVTTLAQPPQGWTPEAGYLGQWILKDATVVRCEASGTTAIAALKNIDVCIGQK